MKNGGIITIEKVKSGCGWTSAALPRVRLGEPVKKDGFVLYDVDTVKIYISKNLMPKEN